MRAKLVNESVGDYPAGAQNDPSAPWNETESTYKDIILDQYGDVYITTNDNDDIIDKSIIDAYYLDVLLSTKLSLDFKKLEQEGETIEVKSIEKVKDNLYNFETKYGDALVSLKELEDLK